jgi:hypothetical protein
MAGTVLSSGSFVATGTSSTFPDGYPFGVQISGTFVGTVVLERSLDDGTTWIQPTLANGLVSSWTAPASQDFEVGEFGNVYRFRCTAYTSGTINYLAIR